MASYLSRRDGLDLDLRYGTTPPLPSIRRAAPTAASGVRGVVVKSWMGSPGTTGAHLRYLTQGKGTDGTDTTLFNAQGYVHDPSRFRQAAQSDGHQFRWVVSLVDADQLSLMAYIQTLMSQVEQDTRRPLDWVAATHRDTGHVHTHVVVRGRDHQGQSVFIPLPYLNRGLRARATDLATAWLGRVPVVERMTHQTAWRVLLTAIMKHVKEDGSMDANYPTQLDADHAPDAPPSHELATTPDPSGLLARLAALQAILQQRLLVKEASQDKGMEV